MAIACYANKDTTTVGKLKACSTAFERSDFGISEARTLAVILVGSPFGLERHVLPLVKEGFDYSDIVVAEHDQYTFRALVKFQSSLPKNDPLKQVQIVHDDIVNVIRLVSNKVAFVDFDTIVGLKGDGVLDVLWVCLTAKIPCIHLTITQRKESWEDWYPKSAPRMVDWSGGIKKTKIPRKKTIAKRVLHNILPADDYIIEEPIAYRGVGHTPMLMVVFNHTG